MTAPAGEKWQHKRGPVLVLLFCVLGPLGLRLLWSSPCFSKAEKVGLSLLSLLEFLVIAKLLAGAYTAQLLSIGADGPT